MTLIGDDVSIPETTTKRNKSGQPLRIVGKGMKFQRIRRITGYLVGTTDRFNNAKQHEERDRVKHVPKPEDCSACRN